MRSDLLRLNPVLVGLLLYVLAQLAVGIAVSLRIRTEDDFFVAGRRLGMPMAAGSIFATWFGAETCVGAAGTIHAEGLRLDSVEPFAYGLCLMLTGLVFAAPFWRRRVTTLADLFRDRFGGGVERLAALILIPTSVLWAAAQVRAFGQVLAASSSLDVRTAIVVAAAVAIVYTVLGGLLADVYTDLVQAGALVVGLVVVAVAVTSDLGGLTAAAASIDADRLRLSLEDAGGLLETLEAWAIPLCGSVVAQEVLSRTLAARSEHVARRSALVGGGAYLAIGLIPVWLGLVGPLVVEVEDPEQVLPALALAHLSTLGYVIFAGALVSAILSTVDSTLLVASSLLSRNLILAARPEASQLVRLATARGGVVLFGVLATLLALGSEGIFELIESASGFGSAGILVVVVFALFSRRGGTASATAALVGGTATWIVGAYLVEWRAPYLASLAVALAGYLALSRARTPAAAS